MRSKFKKLIPYLLLSPAIIYYILFWIRPVIRAIIGSVTDFDGQFSLQFFIKISKDPMFLTALKNSLLFAFISVALQFIIAFIMALLLNQKFKGVNLLLFVALIPMAVPPAAVAILWKSGFSAHGWFNNILMNLHIIHEPILWLTAQGYTALLFLILIDTWTVLPSVMIILLAGLQNLNKEYEEAGLIFGANKFQVVKDIIMPILRPTIVTAVILRMIAAIQVWMITVMMFGYGREPFLVERIAYYTDEVSMLKDSYKLSLTYSVIVTIIVMTSVAIYLRVSNRGKKEVSI